MEASTSALPAASGDKNAEREAKMAALRRRMHDSTQANRKDAIAESTTRKLSVQEANRLDRKRKIAEALGEQIEAEESGIDTERKRAWEYTVEDNDKWDAKLKKKERRAQFEFTDYDDVARRKYKRDIDELKPDTKAYNEQKRAALGITGGSTDMVHLEDGEGSGAVQRANDLLYRDANSFVYADHKPSEEAIDKVVTKLNLDVDKRNKFSRKRKEGHHDVTYINDKNKQFNKKLERYFNKYTEEIRNNFERGTAL